MLNRSLDCDVAARGPDLRKTRKMGIRRVLRVVTLFNMMNEAHVGATRYRVPGISDTVSTPVSAVSTAASARGSGTRRL